MVRDRQSVRSLSTPPGAARSARHGEQVGTLIREWRGRRRLSQMALALDAGISTRHLSFVETGRSRPSPQLLLALAEQLEVPLRERNALLLAGGYAPRFAEHPIDSPVLAEVRQALSRLLRAHDPFPAFAVDRHWNVVLANGASHRMLSLLPAWLAESPVNLFRASLHPEGFAAMTENFAEWGGYLLDQLDRLVAEAAAQGDGDGLSALVEEVGRYPNVARLSAERKRDAGATGIGDSLVLPCVMSFGGQRATLFTTIATLGAARDLTLSELRLELFYPADAETDALLRGWAADAAAPKR